MVSTSFVLRQFLFVSITTKNHLLTKSIHPGHEQASRQNDIVQGRIILDGTLFPNISSRIVHDITSARQQIFNELSRSLEKLFRLDCDNLEYALDSDNKAVLHINQDRVLMELLSGRIQRLQLQHQNLLERFPQL